MAEGVKFNSSAAFANELNLAAASKACSDFNGGSFFIVKIKYDFQVN